MATSVITADTPMIIPSIVRPVRILLRPRALKAMRKVMAGDIVVSLPAASAGSTAAAIAAAATTAAATAGLSEREVCRGRTRLVAERHVRDDLAALLQIAFDQLGALPVR